MLFKGVSGETCDKVSYCDDGVIVGLGGEICTMSPFRPGGLGRASSPRWPFSPGGPWGPGNPIGPWGPGTPTKPGVPWNTHTYTINTYTTKTVDV